MKNNYIIIIAILLLSCTKYFGQELHNFHCFSFPYNYEVIDSTVRDVDILYDYKVTDNLVQQQIKKRNDRFDFHQTMKIIRTPSTISSFTNYKEYYLGQDKRPFLMQADANLPVAIPGLGRYVYSTFHLIPRFKFRIFQNDERFMDESNPVRTPSAMPGIAWYFTPHPWWSAEETSFLRKNKYFGLYLFHHSNGQDGHEIEDNNINVYNGNFGEQLAIEFIYGSRDANVNLKEYSVSEVEKKFAKKVENRTRNRIIKIKYASSVDRYWQLGYEWHPKLLELSNPIFDKKNMYGRNRINFDLNYLVYSHIAEYISDGYVWCLFRPKYKIERWRHHFDFTYIADTYYERGKTVSSRKQVKYTDLTKRLNANYTLYYVIDGWKNFAFFGQVGYMGTDEYNIYFNDSYAHLRFGIAYGFFDQPSLYKRE